MVWLGVVWCGVRPLGHAGEGCDLFFVYVRVEYQDRLVLDSSGMCVVVSRGLFLWLRV